MTLADYYERLGITSDATVEEIKKAYRKKARLFHPDINNSADAKDLFIGITEAYEFLISYHEKIKFDDEAYRQAMEEWRKYRQEKSRRHATAYARASYENFKKSKLYKTSRIFDKTTIIFSFGISIMVLVYTVYGYTYRLSHPLPGIEKPSLFAFIMLLLLGLIFFVVSFIYLRAYQENSRKGRK